MIKKCCVMLLMMVSVHALADASLDDLKKRLNSFSTMSANFKQSIFAGKNAQPQKSKGTMALRRPGKFIWKTTYPNEQTLIANGKTVWIYDIDLEQATKQKMNTNSTNSPAVFLTGDVSQVPARFTVLHPDNGDVFILKAKDDDDMFQHFTLYFKGEVLTKMEVITKLDQKSRFEFSNVKINPAFAQNYFNFKPPKGVEVIENK